MASRRDLVRMMVLDSICDDYEDLHQITKTLTDFCSRCGMEVETPEVLQTLSDLIDGGLANA